MTEKITTKSKEGKDSKFESLIKDPYLPNVEIKPNSFLSMIAVLAIGANIPSKLDTDKVVTTPENRSLAVEIMGQELVQDLENLGFVIEVPVQANASGRYLVHLGQVHDSPIGFIDRAQYAEEVSNFQNDIEQVAVELSRLGSGIIFDEGLSDSVDEMLEMRDNVIKYNEQLLSFQENTLQNPNDVAYLIALLSEYYQSNNIYLKMYVDSSVVDKLTERVTTHVNSLPITNDNEVEIKNILTDRLSTLDYRALFSMVNSNQFNGLVRPFMAGHIKLAPTENVDLNSRGIEILNTLRTLERQYEIERLQANLGSVQIDALHDEIVIKYGFRNNLTEAENAHRTELRNQIAAIERQIKWDLDNTPIGIALKNTILEYEAVIYDQRENEVLRRITEMQNYGYEFQHYVVRFGQAHDFADNVMRYNRDTESIQDAMGLIKIYQPWEQVFQ